MKDRELLLLSLLLYVFSDAELNVGVSMIMNISIIRLEFWSSVAIMALKF